MNFMAALTLIFMTFFFGVTFLIILFLSSTKQSSKILKALRLILRSGLIIIFLLLAIIWCSYQFWQAVSYETFLGTIGGGLIAVITIVFTLILIPIQHFAEHYTVEALKEFKKDRYVRALFLMISAIALAALFLLGFYSGSSLFLSLVMYTLTVLCLYSLYLFYFHAIDLLDARKIVTKKCQRLAKIAQNSTVTSSNPRGDSMSDELIIPEQIVLKSIERNETEVAIDSIREITRLAYLITGMTKTPTNAKLLERIINLYLRTLLQALKYNNQAKFHLIYLIRDIILLRSETNPFNKEYLSHIMQYLYNANKLIIDNDEDKLFKAELDYFSSLVDKDKHVEREFYDVFFMIGSYALWTEGKERFIKAIWTNIDQESSHIHFVGNKNLINFDIKFLSEQQMRLSELGKFTSEIFRGIRPCIIKYYVLCLTYALHRLEKTWEIVIPEDDEQKRKLYIFLDEMRHAKKEFQRKCDELKEEAVKWSDVIKPKKVIKTKKLYPKSEENKVKENSIVTITTQDAFENTKKWFDEMDALFEDRKRTLLQLLQLDNEKVTRCREGILKSYKNNSIVSKVLSTRLYDEERDSNKSFLHIGKKFLIDRFWFTSPTAEPVFSELGENVALGETNYLLDQIREHQETKTVEEINHEVIKSAVEELKTEGFDPSSLFVPIDYFVQLHKWKTKTEETEFPTIRYESDEPYFMVDASKKLRIFWSSKHVKLESFILVAKSFGEWIVKPSESGEPLTVEISEHRKDKTKIELLIDEVFYLEVIEENAARIIKKKHESS